MKIKKVLSVVLSSALGMVLLLLVLFQAGAKNILVHLKNLNYWWILSAIALYTVDMIIRAYRWKEILKDNNILLKVRDSFLAYNLGNSLNIIIPAKIGDVARSYYLKKRYGFEYSRTLPATFLDRFFDVVGVYIVILVSAIYVVSHVTMPDWFFSLMIAGIAGLIIVFLGIWFIIKCKSRIDALKNTKIKSFLYSLIEVFIGSIKNKGKFMRLTVCSILIWACDGLFTYMIFSSMGQNVNPFVAILSNMLATLTKIFPVTPGGIGVFEGAMVILFSMFGFDRGVIGVLSTLDHFLMNLYTVAVGLYVLLSNNIRIAQISLEKENTR